MSGLRVEIEGAVATLTLSRPEARNALNDEVRVAFEAALTSLDERLDVRVIVVQGDGPMFSAGADLRSTAYPEAAGDWLSRRFATGTWQRLLEHLDRMPQTTVARLHGMVIGGASLVAAVCDIRVAADDTVVRIPELAIGIPLTWAGIPYLVREVGLPLTRDWVMTCRDVRTDELLRSGYAQRVAPRAELDDAVARLVGELLAVPAAPLAMTKAMTAALGRSHPAMAAGWGDADHMMWSLGEEERKDAARAYLARTINRKG